MDGIYVEVANERLRQDRVWGGPNNDDKNKQAEWIKWIVEYSMGVGRANGRDFRRRMIQVAALAVAAVESQDRLDRFGSFEGRYVPAGNGDYKYVGNIGPVYKNVTVGAGGSC